ncbi:MAG: glycosyltransferase family 4 protein [Desulfobacterales bacterium]|nr:glycosyltransferase family 4 protein [Desulfobacterales bacterium]
MLLGGLGAFFTPHWAPMAGLVDRPNARSSHTAPTPRGGGVGILMAFVAAGFYLDIPPGFWMPMAALSIVSLWGDRSEIPPRLRLILQFILALISIWSLPQMPWTLGIILILPLAVFMVGSCNIYNFMDGINGIAAGTGMVGFAFLAIFAMVNGIAFEYVVFSGVMATACLGFLPFNVPRARTFMGDVGSILLGFAFAGLSLFISKNAMDLITCCGMILPFYADGLSTLAVRAWDGENLTAAHRRHLYQLLSNEWGIPHWKVSLGYCLVQLGIGATLVSIHSHPRLSLIFLVFCFFGFCILSAKVRSLTHKH